MSTKKEIEQRIIGELQSPDEEVVLEAIENAKTRGNDNILEALLYLFISTDNPMIYASITNVLKDLKSQSSLVPLMKVIKDPKSKVHRTTLVSVIWESGLKTDDQLLFFTDLAINENYTTCLEALTVIENMTGNFSSEDLDEAIERVNTAISTNKDEKIELLKDLKLVLDGFRK